MNNGSLTQFLDTGWYTEATLFYNGYIYWCEGCTDFDTDITKFYVAWWKVKKENDEFYHTICGKDLEPIGYEVVYENEGQDSDLIKKNFLSAKIFDGKSFWEVEKDLLWLEDSGEDIIVEE